MVMVRRREKHRHMRVVVIPAPDPRRTEWEEMERLMSEDPDDRAIREAHGFTYEDDFEDRSLLCRNGCGNTYFDVAVGKIRECRSVPF